MPGDPYAAIPPARPFVEAIGAAVPPLRIGIRTVAPAGACAVAPECVTAASEAARMLEAIGHVVEDTSPAALDEEGLLATFLVIASAAVAHDLARIAAIAGRDLEPDDVEVLTWAYAEMAERNRAGDLAIALDEAHAWSRRVAAWWEPDDPPGGFDLLLTPTVAAPPPRIGDVVGDAADPWATLAAATPFGAFTLPFNVTGQPAASLPLAFSGALPAGVQLVAAPGREDLLLSVAARREAEHPWSHRRPPT
jgi:amidase